MARNPDPANSYQSRALPRTLPLALAVGIHLLVLGPAILAPHLNFWQRPQPEDIQTVTLFTTADLPAPTIPATSTPTPRPEPTTPPPPEPVPELKPEPEPGPEPEPVTVPEPEPEPQPEPEPEPTTPTETAEPATIPPAPSNPRVITPRRQLKVAPEPPPPISTRPSRTAEDLAELDRIRENAHLEHEARQADRRAEAARHEALAAIRESILAQAERRQSPPTAEKPPVMPAPVAPPPIADAPATSADTAADPATTGPTGGSQTVDAATREYLSRLHSHIQAHWSLPDMPSWNEELLAILVITIDRNGTVRQTMFEKQAENMYFNQLVRKTIQDAEPLPPFPPALRQEEMEVGLRFRPGEVF